MNTNMEIQSFTEIYTQFYKSSFLFVKSYVIDDMIAEDIVSESLMRLWQAMRRETVEYPYSFLLTILKNKALNQLRHQDIQLNAMENIASDTIRDLNYRIQTLEACDPTEIYSSEISTILEKTLLSLPDQTRRIFKMSRFENRSVKEIAEELSIHPKSVEYHITKALKVVRIALKDYLPILQFLIGA